MASVLGDSELVSRLEPNALSRFLLCALAIHLGILVVHPGDDFGGAPSREGGGSGVRSIDLELSEIGRLREARATTPTPALAVTSSQATTAHAQLREMRVAPSPRGSNPVSAPSIPKPPEPSTAVTAERVTPREAPSAAPVPPLASFVFGDLRVTQDADPALGAAAPPPTTRGVGDTQGVGEGSRHGPSAGKHGVVVGTGKGTKAALRGKVCFIPEDTRTLTEIGDCKVEGELATDTLNVAPRDYTRGYPGILYRYEWFLIDYRGSFTVGKDGVYVFRLLSDDGSVLWIDGHEVIDHDGVHMALSKSEMVNLEAGSHSIRVRYFQGPRGAIALQLFVRPPGGVERLFTPRIE